MVTIEYLHKNMHHVPLLSQLWWSLLGRIWAPDVGTDVVESWMYSWKHEDQLPVGHVALAEGRPIGFCALQKTDGVRSELSPWLTDLCVDPAYQRHGVGRQLIHTTENKALELGFKKLYLFAFDVTLPEYYQRLGFSVIGLDSHRGSSIIIMEKTLSQLARS